MPRLCAPCLLARHATDVGLVYLHDPVQLAAAIPAAHRPPDAVHHEQGTLVAHARHALNLLGAHAFLAGARGSEREAPVLEGNRAVLHDRADAHRVLLFAAPAAPQEPLAPLARRIPHLVHVGIATARAAGGVAPPLALHVLHGGLVARPRRW